MLLMLLYLFNVNILKINLTFIFFLFLFIKMSYVYLIGNKNVGLYKIGITRSPERRLKTNQTSCPYVLEIINVFQSEFASKLEKVLHSDYSQFKIDENDNEIKGEWFSLNEEQVSKFINKCNLYNQNFDLLKNSGNYHFNKLLKK